MPVLVSHRQIILIFFIFIWQYSFSLKTLRRTETSRVTRVTLVLLIGNETLREMLFTLWEASCVTDVWSPYRITPIHWLMARRRPWRIHVVSLYWRTRHPLLRFLCRKEPCRQSEELGSERSVSFPIKRTRVTRVTRDVLYHRFTYAVWKALHTLGTIYQTRQAKNAAYMVQ